MTDCKWNSSRGSPAPYGTHCQEKGVNFAIFIYGFPRVKLRIKSIKHEVLAELDVPYQTGQVKHLFIEHLTPPFIYSYLINDKEVLDPYAKHLSTTNQWGENTPYNPLGLVLKRDSFDFGEFTGPGLLKEDLIIYEMHVRGFTNDPSSNVKSKGSFLGVIEKIPYLKELGINAVEIMPIHEFNENEYKPINPLFEGKLHQYWGYSSVSFFALMNRYASTSELGASVQEFKQMVLALHEAEIEVIVDIVFNHTGEGNDKGPIQSFKVLGKEVYYLLEPVEAFANYTGCGNTFNCNHPIGMNLILDALRYLVIEMHVDGFRFDLASIFYRGQDGSVLETPPLLEAMTKDPLLSGVKLIAEPWDAAGLYQVGSFFHESARFGEWNGKYRDCIRTFIKGTGNKGQFATRLSGSEDLFGHYRRLPRNSINFVTSHDGFTLCDLVSYNSKHNEENGEENRDGSNDNASWNCGFEGVTQDPEILKLRERQMRNFHLALMVSQGVPMLTMGDEYGQTKEGNNNTWCQDNRLSWFQWDTLEKNSAYFRFYKGLIHFRKTHSLLRRRQFLRDDDIVWHGIEPANPLWEKEDQFLAFTLIDKELGNDLYAAFNASNQPVSITFPAPRENRKWHWVVRSQEPSPSDFQEAGEEVTAKSYIIERFSSLLLRCS